MFDYIFNDSQTGGGKPKLKLVRVDETFDLFGKSVSTLPAWHGDMEVYGYRIGDVAYLTDCNRIPEETLKKLKGLKVLIIGAIRMESHATHMTIEEALEVAETVSAGKTYLTHLNHNVRHGELSKKLPPNHFLAYDRLELTV
jgi:phosphoribosyl 1,2-cyclic phosphate phosphodiesterase